MDMTSQKENHAGWSDPQCRQEGAIVPDPLRSGRLGKSSDGLPAALTASAVGEYAIAGRMGACTVRALTVNISVKKCTECAQRSCIGLGDGVSPLRLRGGGSDRDSTDEECTTKRKGASKFEQRRRAREVVSPSSDDARPGPSGVHRSRSRIRTRTTSKVATPKEGEWKRCQKRVTRSSV